MKSLHLAVIICVTASLSVGCSADQTASLKDSVQPESNVLSENPKKEKDKTQVALSSNHGRDALSGDSASFVSRGAPVHKNLIAKPSRPSTTSGRPKSASYSTPVSQGRDNPFALAEQPEFEVRFLAAAKPAAVQPLPPVPSVGLGPEAGGASLQPLVAAPVVTQLPTNIQQGAVSQLPASLPETDIATGLPLVSPVVDEVLPMPKSPTALAEAVEIKGIVQLGDYSAVIVKDSDGALSRTVQPGARLAGGQVELRRIETTTAEPQVVLVQNGIEIVRGVGV